MIEAETSLPRPLPRLLSRLLSRLRAAAVLALRSGPALALAVAVALAMVLAAPPALAAEANGIWARPGGSSRIQIAPCGGALCGTLVWLREPRNDTNNPDPARRSRPLLGSQTVFGMVADGGGRWKGKVYNAEDGKTYSGVMTLVGNTGLKLEGCVLGGLICKGETWQRVK